MRALHRYLILAVAAVLVVATVGVTPAGAQGESGTGLSASIQSAAMHWERVFPWTIDKSADTETLELDCGGSGTVTYTVALSKGTGVDQYYLSGVVRVTNTGAVATAGLSITARVLYKTGGGPFQLLISQPVDVSANPSIPAGQWRDYPYRVDFTPVAGAQYKAEVQVTITNHSGHLGVPWGPTPAQGDVSLPLSPTLINDTVHVVDDNLPLEEGEAWNWAFSATGQQTYDLTFTCPDDAGLHENTATIVETEQSDGAAVTVTCAPCSEGCTRTIGYWKNHAGFGPQADEVTPLLPVSLGSVEVADAADAVAILEQEGASNGIVKLYAQLLAAKLNIKGGADGSAVADTIAAADAFLTTHDADDWDSLSAADRGLVNGWRSTLDDYNNGVIGPGHCE